MHYPIRPLIRRGGAIRRHPGAALAQAMGLAIVLALSTGAAATQSGSTAKAIKSLAASPQSTQAQLAQPQVSRKPRILDFVRQPASPEVKHLAYWIDDADDNGRMPYLIVDKVNAEVFAFAANGQLLGAAPALLGMARGDGSVKGIGKRKLSAIGPADRTTPAGRFIASLSHDVHGQEILVIDYADSIALHPVVKGTPQERRAERLLSPTPKDNRISFGCINVPLKFYESIVSPEFTHTTGVVYILPETTTARKVFGSYDVDVGAHERITARSGSKSSVHPL